MSYSFPYRSKGPALCPRQVAGIWKAPTLVLAQLSWPDKLKNTRKHLLLFFFFFQINHLCVIVTFIFLYSCESWSLTAELQRRIQVMEMGCYCKILRISYRDRVTNEEVRAKIQRAIGPHEDLNIVTRRKVQWNGHVSRSSGLAKIILQGTVKGGRRQGRQR